MSRGRLSLPAAIAVLVVALVLTSGHLLRTSSGEGSSGLGSELVAELRGERSAGRDPPMSGSHTSRGVWYEIAFTDPRLSERRSSRSAPEERLVTLMNHAQRTLDVASYEFDLESVAEAMARAAHRGVRVRMVTDADTLHSTRESGTRVAFAKLRAAEIPVVADTRRQIMHHKFTIVDGEWVQTGSWNYTLSEAYRNNNNSIVVQSSALAQNYTAEFEKMFVHKQFGGAKPPGIPQPTLGVAGARVETYFSPQDRAGMHIVRWLAAARQRIHFMAFSFTHDGIGDAMLERARAGVKVEGVFETAGSETQFSEFRRMKQAGLDVLLDGNPGALHHKVIVIDDRISIFGSFNFSANADRQNDENLLIVDDPGLAAAFEMEYQRVRAQALNPAVRR